MGSLLPAAVLALWARWRLRSIERLVHANRKYRILLNRRGCLRCRGCRPGRGRNETEQPQLMTLCQHEGMPVPLSVLTYASGT